MNTVGAGWHSPWHELQGRLAIALGAGAPSGRGARDPDAGILKAASWIDRARSGGHIFRQEAPTPK